MKAKLVKESLVSYLNEGRVSPEDMAYGDSYVSDTTQPKPEPQSNPDEDWPAPEEWTYQEGEMVEFDLRGMGSEWKSSEDRKTADVAESHDQLVAKIIGQATFTEVGNPDFEYYDIQFEDGEELYAVSGYHLLDV